MAVTTTNLGVITAYGDAVAAGYTGTKAEWQALMASYATVGQQAVDAKNDAVAAKNTAVSKATEATTAAGTATTKANEASASAQSIAQSAAQIAQNTSDISELKEDLLLVEDDIVLKGVQKTISDLQTGLYYSGEKGSALVETSNSNSIYIKFDVSKWIGHTLKIELNELVTGSRNTGFCDTEEIISYIKNQPSINSFATLNEITGLYEIELKIVDAVFFFSYNNSVTTVNISIADTKKIYTKAETNAVIASGLSNPKFVHFSFDDVVFCMTDLTNNADNYSSIFDNAFFAKLKQVHDDYGTIFSLYLFTESISTWTAKFKTEFSANKDWLKFGLHVNRSTANDYSKTTAEQALADYNEFVEEIYRITGDYGCIDKCPRLSAFSGNQASCLAMRDANCGIVGLLSAYDDRDSYYLSSTDSNYVFVHGRLYDPTNRITLFHTYKTIEVQNPITVTLPNLLTAEGNNGSEYLIMMGHEYAFYDSNYQLISTYLDRIDYVSDWANNHGYLWQYPMNRILR